MATAEEFEPAADLSPPKSGVPKKLLSVAALLAAIFAAAAFIFLVVRDHGHARIMVNDQTAPVRKAGLSPSRHDSTGQAAQSAGLGAQFTGNTGSGDLQSFTLTRSKRTVQLGPVRVRLLRSDPAHGIFDMSVIVGRRSHSHRNLKINEPIWIAANRGGAPIQVVITAIKEDGITGHWQQSSTTPQVSTRSTGGQAGSKTPGK